MTTSNPDWSNGTTRECQCIACGKVSQQSHVVTVSHVDHSKGLVDYYKCAHCCSLNIRAESMMGYTEPGSFFANSVFTRHYLQVGAGIDFMLRPLQRVARNGGRLLDVGCGFGYTLDYWTNNLQGNAVGLEASGYGALGNQLLGVDIRPEYLSGGRLVDGGNFDCVFTTEVLEHVDNPPDFVRSLSDQVSEGGLLVITTPNADYIAEDASRSSVLAALSPGVHTVLLSRSALHNILLQSSFPYIEVEIAEERLVAYASRKPFKLKPRPTLESHEYRQYLTRRLRNCKHPDLKLGFAYRLFKELVNGACFEEAADPLDAYRKTVHDEFSFDCTDIALRQDFPPPSAATPEEYAMKAPFSLPCFLFYFAMYTAQVRGTDGQQHAANLFHASARMCAHMLHMAPQYSQEAATLHWPAIYERGAATLRSGDRETAIGIFDLLLKQACSANSTNSLAELLPGLVFRAATQKAIANLQLGRPEQAMEILRLQQCAGIDKIPQEELLEAGRIWELACEQALSSFKKARHSPTSGAVARNMCTWIRNRIFSR